MDKALPRPKSTESSLPTTSKFLFNEGRMVVDQYQSTKVFYNSNQKVQPHENIEHDIKQEINNLLRKKHNLK